VTADSLATLCDREALFDIIRRTAALLDNEALDDWLALFAAESLYEIRTYGPEIQADMVWWHSNRDKLSAILAEAKEHVRDPGRRLHLITPISADVSDDRAVTLSHFGILRTDQGGNSAVYVAGRYEDSFVRQDDGWLYEAHRAVLDTRVLEPFTHLPL
jgi:3-phenylpropionate/cinnamic acid dioxygenase small subunit